MKIAYVVDTFPRRSELFIRREIDELGRQGVEVEVFSLRRPEKPDPDAVYLPLVSAGIGTMCAAVWHIARALNERPARAAARICRSPAAAALAAAVRSGEFDAIHAHFLGVASTLALAASKITGVPLTISAHAGDIFRTGEAVPAAGAHARAVFACCRANLEELVRRGVPGDRIHVAYHGLPRDFPRDARRDRRMGDTPLILALGRFVEKKGFKYLIRALRDLSRWELEFRCVIAGDGPLREDLLREAEAMQVTERVEFPGWVEGEEKTRLYSEADILVCPSIVAPDGDRDGIPNVLLEAAAQGVPIVAADAGGIPEVIEDESTGLLVPQYDPVLIADAISRYVAGPELCDTVTAGARALLDARFDLAENVRILTDTWESTAT